MAEFTKVAKEYVRLCESHPNCMSSCPMNQYRDKAIMCRYWTLVEEPEKAEKIIMEWAAEHPVKTNGNIFKDTYGFDLEYLFILTDAKGREEWAKHVYKEPEDEHDGTV